MVRSPVRAGQPPPWPGVARGCIGQLPDRASPGWRRPALPVLCQRQHLIEHRLPTPARGPGVVGPRQALRGPQQFREARGSAPRIAALEQVDGGFRVLGPVCQPATFSLQGDGQVLYVAGHAPALADLAGPHQQAGSAHAQRRLLVRAVVQPLLALCIEQQPGQDAGCRAAVEQHLQHAAGMPLHQAAGQLLPDPLRDQGIHFSGRHHLLQQRQGLGRNTELGPARRKTRNAQQPHGVFLEGRRDMAQYSCLQVLPATEGVDELPGGIHGHGVDGQVAPRQVVFQRD